MTDQARVQVNGVVAVAIPVEDQDAALAFYTGVLGCELVADDVVGPAFRWVEVRPPGSATGIALLTSEEGSPARRAASRRPEPG